VIPGARIGLQLVGRGVGVVAAHGACAAYLKSCKHVDLVIRKKRRCSHGGHQGKCLLAKPLYSSLVCVCTGVFLCEEKVRLRVEVER
jgi:nitrite reductase/ring-hydroxylating ferredoxin subunit